MTTPKQSTSVARFAGAARRLVEGDVANAAAGRFSRTVFVIDKWKDDFMQKCMFEAALKQGLGAVVLRYGRDTCSTPRRANLAFLHEGQPLFARDCVLWSEEEGPVLLVPFDARADYHFGIGPQGIERRKGRPAASLGEGMARARARLERTARDLRHDGLDHGISIASVA